LLKWNPDPFPSLSSSLLFFPPLLALSLPLSLVPQMMISPPFLPNRRLLLNVPSPQDPLKWIVSRFHSSPLSANGTSLSFSRQKLSNGLRVEFLPVPQRPQSFLSSFPKVFPPLPRCCKVNSTLISVSLPAHIFPSFRFQSGSSLYIAPHKKRFFFFFGHSSRAPTSLLR